MKVSEAITKLKEILKKEGDLPIVYTWAESDEDGEEYTIKEEPFFYVSIFNEVHIGY